MSPYTCIFNVSPPPPQSTARIRHRTPVHLLGRYRTWHFSAWRCGRGCQSARRAAKSSDGWGEEVNTARKDGLRFGPRVAAAAPAPRPGPGNVPLEHHGPSPRRGPAAAPAAAHEQRPPAQRASLLLQGKSFCGFEMCFSNKGLTQYSAG